MSTQTEALAFGEIVAGWDRRVQCEKVSGLPHQCRNPANWRGVMHCRPERTLLCTRHKNLWIALHRNIIERCGAVNCYHCNQPFDAPELIATFTRV